MIPPNRVGLDVRVKRMRFPRARVDLIHDFELEVDRGEVISLLGPSGCGKTTLLRMIAGLETEWDGEVLYGGRPMRRPGRSVQVLFQDSRLLPWMTVRENVRFALQDSNGLGDIAVDQWLRKVGLHDLSGAWPRTLSGGEESRVAFARTFVDPPQVLLLDEPFRNLDIVTKLGLIGELGSHLAEFAITAVLVSHDVMDAVLLSDRVVVLEARPLRVQRIFDIGLPWPRDFRSAAVLSTVGEIVENLHPTAMPEDLDDSHRDGGKPPT